MLDQAKRNAARDDQPKSEPGRTAVSGPATGVPCSICMKPSSANGFGARFAGLPTSALGRGALFDAGRRRRIVSSSAARVLRLCGSARLLPPACAVLRLQPGAFLGLDARARFGLDPRRLFCLALAAAASIFARSSASRCACASASSRAFSSASSLAAASASSRAASAAWRSASSAASRARSSASTLAFSSAASRAFSASACRARSSASAFSRASSSALRLLRFGLGRARFLLLPAPFLGGAVVLFLQRRVVAHLAPQPLLFEQRRLHRLDARLLDLQRALRQELRQRLAVEGPRRSRRPALAG